MRLSHFGLALACLAVAGGSACTSSSPAATGPAPAGTNHSVHLRTGALSTPLSCDSCHAPTGFAVDFSQNPALQAAGARFDPVTKTCSNISCHGTFRLGTVSGTNATVVWSDLAPVTCTSCHALPPLGHPAIAGTPTAASCASCHEDTVNADGTINLATGAHLNGKADVTGGTCSSCHGDASRVPSMAGVDSLVASAPPLAPPGAPAFAEGAHLGHMNPDPASPVATPIACAECHAVPTDSVHATSPPPARVAFGPLAGARGATPTFVLPAAGCQASYCHGNFTYGKVTGTSATPLWTDTVPMTCASCHGMPPTGHPAVANSAASACNACHNLSIDSSGAVIPGGAHLNGRDDIAALGCTNCHGDPARVASLPGADVNLVSSPPVASAGTPAATVGAHLGHLNPTAGTALMGPMACAECHLVPTNFDHATTPPAQKVLFGSLARSGGAAPTYVPASLGCAATYCHGNFTFNGVSGSNATVAWTSTAPLACTACHGMPPTGHPPIANATAAGCAQCHPRSVNPDGTINLVDRGHLNGLPDTSALGCATCHGNAARTGNLPGTDANLVSAPPVAPPGSPAFATGAHEGHVNPTATSVLMPPIACAECHVVPADSAHAKTPPAAVVVFGAFSRTGGAAPTWATTTAGCAATYCHGSFNFNGVLGARATPLWTDTAPMTCTSCHGMPPTGHLAVATPVTAASCAPCHPDAINANGTINRTAGGHLNGRADVNALACTSCHGDATRKGNLVGTDANLTSAPPIAQPGAPAFAVGAHMGHMNPTTASYLMPPIACAECHPVPADAAHATNPPAQKVVFGTLSKTGGALPTFNATTSGCSATWCHGNFTLGAVSGNKTAAPLWTGGAMTCTSCHGMIPTGHPAYTATGGYTAASCFQCHPQSVNADGTIKQGGGHINGKSDGGGCTTCHGDPPTTGKHTNANHRNLACSRCHPAGYTSTTVVDATHNNQVVNLGSSAGYLCGGVASLVGCKTGQTRTCTNSCHGRETW